MRGLRHFILGQSMGGAVTLKAHLREPHEWDGVILVAPMCKVSPFFDLSSFTLRMLNSSIFMLHSLVHYDLMNGENHVCNIILRF